MGDAGFSNALDIAHAALNLASDEAAFISGACIEVDGARCVCEGFRLSAWAARPAQRQ